MGPGNKLQNIDLMFQLLTYMCSKKVKKLSKEVGASGVGEWLSNEVYKIKATSALSR